MIQTTPKKTIGKIYSPGFSLIELIITTLMIAIIAGAIGLAMHQAHNRTNDAKMSLALQQEQNDVISLLRKELPNVIELNSCLAESITFTIPNTLVALPDATVILSYHWDDITNILYRTNMLNNPAMVSDEVYYFDLEYNTYESGGITYARGVAVNLQIGPYVENRFRTFIEFYNHPLMPPLGMAHD